MTMPNTYLSSEMKKAYIREEQIEKYLNYLNNLYKCSRDSYVTYNHSEAAKKFHVSNMTVASLIKMGYVKSIGDGVKKIYKWKVERPNEDLAEKVWERVKADQRAYIMTKALTAAPINKNGNALIPIKLTKKVKQTLTDTKKESKRKRLESTILNVYNFLNDIYINCQLGEVKALVPYVLKYNVGRALPTVMRNNGYIAKDQQTKTFKWLQVEPDNDMVQDLLELVKKYNTSHLYFATEEVKNTPNTPVVQNETKKVENPVIEQPKVESDEEIKNRLVSKLLKAGKYVDAELLLDQLITK